MKTYLNIWPYIMILVLWTLSFCIASHLTIMPQTTNNNSIAQHMLGENRLILAKWLYAKADQYFHRGVPKKKTKGLANNPFRKIQHRLSPDKHVHIEGPDVAEILPWLQLALDMNPHDIQTHLISAFWLANKCKRPDLAHKILQKAQWNNPFCYQAKLAEAQLYIKEKKISKAKQSLDAGLAFIDRNGGPATEEARLDKAALLLYRSLFYEQDGETEKAISQMEEILILFPFRTHLYKRIEELRKGNQPSVLPSRLLNATLEHEQESKSICNHQEHNHKHEH